jgi:hypothetical protein
VREKGEDDVSSTRTSRIPALIFPAVMATVLAAATAGCAEVVLPPSQPGARSSAGPPAAVRDVGAAQLLPVPQAVASRVSGFIYLLAGPDQAAENVWVIGGQTEHQLTSGTKNNAISSVGAAVAGVVVSDDQFNVDDLAKITTRGAWWLPAGRASRRHQGSSATISAGGKIAFVTVPHARGYPDSKNFELRSQDSFTSTSKVVYQSRTPLSDPVFGPANQIAFIVQPKASDYSSTAVFLRSANGHVHAVTTGLGNPDSLVWSANAPDLVVASWPLKAEAISSNGKRKLLPAGWSPMAWNPAGTRLLVASKTSIGLWAPANPAVVHIIGPLSPGFVVGIASWVKKRVSLGIPSLRRT